MAAPIWDRHVAREIRVPSLVLSHVSRRNTLRDNFNRVEKRSQGQASFLKEGDRDEEEETEFPAATRKEGLGVVDGASEKRRETPKYQKYHAKPK